VAKRYIPQQKCVYCVTVSDSTFNPLLTYTVSAITIRGVYRPKTNDAK